MTLRTSPFQLEPPGSLPLPGHILGEKFASLPLPLPPEQQGPNGPCDPTMQPKEEGRQRDPGLLVLLGEMSFCAVNALGSTLSTAKNAPPATCERSSMPGLSAKHHAAPDLSVPKTPLR